MVVVSFGKSGVIVTIGEVVFTSMITGFVISTKKVLVLIFSFHLTVNT